MSNSSRYKYEDKKLFQRYTRRAVKKILDYALCKALNDNDVKFYLQILKHQRKQLLVPKN